MFFVENNGLILTMVSKNRHRRHRGKKLRKRAVNRNMNLWIVINMEVGNEQLMGARERMKRERLSFRVEKDAP